MKFNLLVLINLVAVISIECYSPKSDLHPSTNNCNDFVGEIISNFKKCEISEKEQDIVFTADALPYVCLISLDVGREFCKVPDRLKLLGQMNRTKSVCPIDYAVKFSYPNGNITIGVQFMSDESNCKSVCKFNPNMFHVCQFIAFASKILKEDSIKENPYQIKQVETKSQDLIQKNKTSSLAGLDKKFSESANLTKSNILQKIHENTVQSVPNDEFDGSKPVTDIDSDLPNEKTSDGNIDLKSDDEIEKEHTPIENNNPNKDVYEKQNSNKTVKKPTVINDKKNDKFSKKQSENKKSKVMGDENTNISETELQSISNKIYSSENNLNNNNNKNNSNNINSNINNNINNNDNNNDFGDDTLKTLHDEGEDNDDNNDEISEKVNLQDALSDREPQFGKSLSPKEIYSSDNFFQAEDSHFSIYFLTTVSIIIIGYVIFHNKKKIVAYALEGRRSRNGRRRPTSASYRKLDCNLEEAITSNPSNTSVTNVVY